MKKNFFGYEKQITLLENLIDKEQLPHGILLNGPDGNGLPHIAAYLASALMCENKNEGKPCGSCRHCRQISQLSHPDVFWMFPVFKSKDIQHAQDALRKFREFYFQKPYFTLKAWSAEMDAENKQLQMGVEDAKQLIQHLALTSLSGRWKVVIIWGMEKMNTEASNKLLKILEEPDAHTKFICITHKPADLLPTIISRLQNVSFPVLSNKDVFEHLKNLNKGLSAEELQNASLNSEGIVSNALEWLEFADHENEFLEHFRGGMRIALKFHPDLALEWIEKTASFPREKQKQFLEYGLNIIRKCMLMHYQSEKLSSILPGEMEFLKKFYAFIPPELVSKWQEVFDESIMHVERNANPKILYFNLVFRFNELLHVSQKIS
jgi:DNA polymerase-3 subunit delta'